MKVYITDLLLVVVLALMCGLLAAFLAAKKKWILAQLEALIQSAETAIQGSGMGAAKKALVLARLEAMGVTVTAWVDRSIDAVVAALNAKRAWYRQLAEDSEDFIPTRNPIIYAKPPAYGDDGK